MKVINFAEQNTVINQYMSELRDKSYQKNRLLSVTTSNVSVR